MACVALLAALVRNASAQPAKLHEAPLQFFFARKGIR